MARDGSLIFDGFDDEFEEWLPRYPRSVFDRYFMKDLAKYTGEVEHVQLAIPKYLLACVDSKMDSRSLFVTMLVEQFFRKKEILDTKIPPLNQLFNVMLAHRESLAKGGDHDASYYRILRASRVYFKRWRHALEARMTQLADMEARATRSLPRVEVGVRKHSGGYPMRELSKCAGGVEHVPLTIPKYLLKYVELMAHSTSVFVTMLIERFFRKEKMLDAKAPPLGQLLSVMRAYRKILGKRGDRNAGYRRLKVRQVYFKRWRRVLEVRMARLTGVKTGGAKLPPRVVVRMPYTRTRQERTDSESERELGKEAFADEPEKLFEMYRQDPKGFSVTHPDQYKTFRKNDPDAMLEDRVDDPESYNEEKGDDPGSKGN